MTASEDNYFLSSFLNDCFSKAAKVVITWSRLNRWKSVLFYRDPGIVINSSKIISYDYVWKFSSWQSRIFHLHCRDLPLPGGNFHVIASPSLSNLFWSISVRDHSHIQVATRDVQWTFIGWYLNCMYAFLCGNCLTKRYCFLPSIGQLAKPKFVSAKYMFAMVPTKE